MLSIKEKKAEFKQLKPKCVNCGKPGGTTFASIISKETDGGKFRELRAFCKAVEPCGLSINIAVGNFENIRSVLKTIDDEIYTAKNEIINDKNKLLFGLTTTEKVLENFDLQKESIRDYTSLLENYLQIYIKITDDPERNEKLEVELEKSYLHIQSIKEALRRFNETNGIEFVKSAVEIYQNQLRPILNEVLKLKYRENTVVFDENNNSYHLVQRNYSMKDLEINNDKFETVVFETSVQGDRTRATSVQGDRTRATSVQGDKTSVIRATKDTSDSSDTPDIIGKPTINEETGTVTWSNKNYQSLWSKMKNELKTALLSDREWMQEFMDSTQMDSNVAISDASVTIYENGCSCLDLLDYIQDSVKWSEFDKSNVLMFFNKVKAEFRCEKMLLMYLLNFLFLRENKELNKISFI